MNRPRANRTIARHHRQRMATMGDQLRQVGWRSKVTGDICDCPVYERSPHANSEPVFVVEESPPTEDGDVHPDAAFDSQPEYAIGPEREPQWLDLSPPTEGDATEA